MDELSIREDTGYSFSSVHQNRMHACGHDFHMTIALGIIDHFVRNPVKQDLLFLFQPAEEGPGGAEPMLESDLFKKWEPSMITAPQSRLISRSERSERKAGCSLPIRQSL
jgi:N-acetyldiaminopimelate deacetylase